MTLTATVGGRGNVKRIPELKVPPLDGLKIYADQPVLKDETTAAGISGSKTMKWAIVPQREGHYRIPALTMSYFDTASERYQTLKTAEVVLSVLPGSTDRAAPTPARSTGANAQAQAKRAVAELGNDILPVHAAIGRPASGLAALPGGAIFWLLLIGPPAAFFLTLGGVVVRQTSGSMTAARSVRKAAAVFMRTCKRSGLTADDLMQALQEYLSQRLSLARGSLTADEAAVLLRSRNVDEKTVKELHRVWRGIEDAIYTGKGRETTAAAEGLARLVARIDKDLR